MSGNCSHELLGACGDQSSPFLIIFVGALCRHVFNMFIFLKSADSKRYVNPTVTPDSSMVFRNQVRPTTTSEETPTKAEGGDKEEGVGLVNSNETVRDVVPGEETAVKPTSTFKRVMQEGLGLVSVICFFIQFGRDIQYIADGVRGQCGWDQYQCIGLTFMNSPNMKASTLFIAAINTPGPDPLFFKFSSVVSLFHPQHVVVVFVCFSA